MNHEGKLNDTQIDTAARRRVSKKEETHVVAAEIAAAKAIVESGCCLMSAMEYMLKLLNEIILRALSKYVKSRFSQNASRIVAWAAKNGASCPSKEGKIVRPKVELCQLALGVNYRLFSRDQSSHSNTVLASNSTIPYSALKSIPSNTVLTCESVSPNL